MLVLDMGLAYAVGKCIGQMSEQLLEVLLMKESGLACY